MKNRTRIYLQTKRLREKKRKEAERAIMQALAIKTYKMRQTWQNIPNASEFLRSFYK